MDHSSLMIYLTIVKDIYAIGGHFRGSHIYWHNLKSYSFNNVLRPFKQFFLRIDIGRWFIIVTQPDPDCYRNVDIILQGGL